MDICSKSDSTLSKASTTAGQNCLPVRLRITWTVASWSQAFLYGRSPRGASLETLYGYPFPSTGHVGAPPVYSGLVRNPYTLSAFGTSTFGEKPAKPFYLILKKYR